MTNSKIIIGLVSFGMSGRIFHAPFIERNPNFELKTILERTKSKSKELYPNTTIVRSFDELLNDVELDLIVINSPTYLHFEMAKQALLANKHVVLEKPMTATSKEGQELLALSNEKSLMMAVYHNKRFEGGYKTVQKLLVNQKLGELLNSKFAVHRYRPDIGPKAWKEETYPGAGILYDIGSHLIDQCLVLFGWPLDLQAVLQIQRNNGAVIDYFELALIYKDFTATIVSDMLTKKSKPTFTLVGTKSTYIKYGADPQESRLAQEPINWDEIGADFPENYGTLTNNQTQEIQNIKTEEGSYSQFYENVYEVLRLNKPLLITPEQALDVIKIIEWAFESTKVIKLNSTNV